MILRLIRPNYIEGKSFERKSVKVRTSRRGHKFRDHSCVEQICLYVYLNAATKADFAIQQQTDHLQLWYE